MEPTTTTSQEPTMVTPTVTAVRHDGPSPHSQDIPAFRSGARVVVDGGWLGDDVDAPGTVITTPVGVPHAERFVWVQLDAGFFDPADDGELPCRPAKVRAS